MTTGNIRVPLSGLIRGINIPLTGEAGGVDIPGTKKLTGLYYGANLFAPAEAKVGDIKVPATTKVGNVLVPAMKRITEHFGATGIFTPAQGSVGGVAVPEMTNVGGVMVPSVSRIKEQYNSFLANKVTLPIVGAMSIGTLALAIGATYFVMRYLKKKKVIKLSTGDRYEVIVGNIGSVYRGSSKTEAKKTFKEYVEDSKTGLGRSGGEQVTLFEDGEPIEEFFGEGGDEDEYSATTPFEGRTEGEGDFFVNYSASDDNIYALTKTDVQWLGNAPAVAGGGVTAWGPNDDPRMGNIVEEHTGREFLGTSPGLSNKKKVTNDELKAILNDWKELKGGSTHRIVQEGNKEIEKRIRQINNWLS